MENIQNTIERVSKNVTGTSEKVPGYQLYNKIAKERGLPELTEQEYREKVNAPKPLGFDYCIPNCPICGGLGRVRHDVPFGHPLFGQYTPCPNAPIESPVWNDCGLTSKERQYTWKNIQRRGDREAERTLEEAYRAIHSVLKKKSGIVTLLGGNGLAKSLLLKIAVAETVRSGNGTLARYTNLTEIIEDLRMSFDEERPGHSLRELEKRFARFPVLAVDELGVERETEFSEEKTFFLIDSRYNAAIENDELLVTLLATNQTLADFPPRIADRLSDGRCHLIHLVGESMRPGMK